MLLKTSNRRRRGWRLALLAAGMLAPLAIAAPAGATGPYPGETLSISLNGPAVSGVETNFLATGQQTDVNDYAGGFLLNVFAKDPRVDPTCAPDWFSEGDAAVTDPTEVRIVIGVWQGPGATFSVPFKADFNPGPVLLCAYSLWSSDTAAAAQLMFNVAAAGSGGSPVGKPVNTARPRITRSGRTLTCTNGSWSNQPSGYAYRWFVDGRLRHGVTGRALRVTRQLRGHRVQCGVQASNAAGRTTAMSRPFLLH